MDTKDLRKLLEKSENKFSVFADETIMSQYDGHIYDLMDLMNEFLETQQRANLFNVGYYKNLSVGDKLTVIINSIDNDDIKLKLIENPNFTVNLSRGDILYIIEKSSDNLKLKIIKQEYSMQIHEIGNSIYQIINSLENKNKKEILLDKQFINKLNLKKSDVAYIIESFEEEQTKLMFIDYYRKEFQGSDIGIILRTFSDKSKIEILLEDKYKLDSKTIQNILGTLSVDAFIEVIKNNKKFLDENEIEIFEITRWYSSESQLKFLSEFENMNLDIKEKRRILATLTGETKREIDISKFPKEYITAIEQDTEKGFIDVDLNQDLEVYKGLDKLLRMKTTDMSKKEKFIKLCQMCPQMGVRGDFKVDYSTGEDYIYTENWIKELLSNIKDEWTTIQKIAFIDNAIGKKVSYDPTFDTEVFDELGSRGLWRIIHSGYGVCNGIAQVEKYILDKIGIKTERISGREHAFLKVKNIKWVTKNGELKQGDTILDPTWNLRAHKYGFKPENFCRSYDEIRKSDIGDDGIDCEAHKNDRDLASCKLDLDDETLRDVFSSIGLADKYGNFPILQFAHMSESLDSFKFSEEVSITAQLKALAKYYPKFATSINETTSILRGISLNQKNQNFKRCVVNRVYKRNDKSKRPILYVYVDFPEAGNKFYVADKAEEKFIEMPQEEFEEKFECYQKDMEKLKGCRPWEELAQTEKINESKQIPEEVFTATEKER